jgi:cystathionine beta-lyase family protein involved in aluminum resistance
MSDRPRIGKVAGKELEETRTGASGLPAAPKILINSVSGEVMVAP